MSLPHPFKEEYMRTRDIFKKGTLPICNRQERCKEVNACENCDIYEMWWEKLRDNFRD